MAVPGDQQPLELAGGLLVRRRCQPLGRLPRVQKQEVVDIQRLLILPIEPRPHVPHIRVVETGRRDLFRELRVVDHLPPRAIQRREQSARGLRAPRLRSPLLEPREHLRAAGVELLECCQPRAVVVQRFPQQPHVARPIQLSASLEQLCLAHAHRLVGVQSPPPRSERVPEGFPQECFEVAQHELGRSLVLSAQHRHSERLSFRLLDDHAAVHFPWQPGQPAG
mmetsp:Transcript_76503/g.234135  ORF Transcript_76503/g.234135 Transcript_76503/m.234135 type:complete len:223 (+) Transcript_76503:640-1308(+)